MASASKNIGDEPDFLIAKLQQLTTRLKNQDDHEAKKECLKLSKALTLRMEQPENVAVDMAFSVP